MSAQRTRQLIQEDGDQIFNAVFQLLDDESSVYQLSSEDAGAVAAITMRAFRRAMEARMGVSLTKKF